MTRILAAAWRLLAWLWLACLSCATAAQEPAAPSILTADEALAGDAAEYARIAFLAPEEALRQLHFQQAGADAVAGLETRFAARLAGLHFEHAPVYRLIVHLTGDEPVPPEILRAGGAEVPVEYRTGAAATRAQMVDAIALHQDAVLAAFPRVRGIGIDPRSASVVVMLNAGAVDDPEAARASLAALMGVPVTIRTLDRAPADFAIQGGARVTGRDADGSTPFLCTVGYAVQGPEGAGVITAAHCPDTLSYREPGSAAATRLPFVGQWGVRYRDVQVNLAAEAEALFFSDRNKRELRPVLATRSRGTLHAGDVVCHRGESSGYSCAEIDLTDFAPPAPLCAGPCDPVWVTVTGPSCRGGDSGGPVFLGSTAVGIVKGGAYDSDRRCHFYFFMSLDYLPDGWSLAMAAPRAPAHAQTPRAEVLPPEAFARAGKKAP